MNIEQYFSAAKFSDCNGVTALYCWLLKSSNSQTGLADLD